MGRMMSVLTQMLEKYDTTSADGAGNALQEVMLACIGEVSLIGRPFMVGLV